MFIDAVPQGHEFNRSLYKVDCMSSCGKNSSKFVNSQAFYDLHIEDMWLPFFCNTTNINTSEMEIHETGYAWRFIRTLSTDLLLSNVDLPLRRFHDLGWFTSSSL